MINYRRLVHAGNQFFFVCRRNLDDLLGLRRSLERSNAWNEGIQYRLCDGELKAVRGILERILMENIVPFWYPATLDVDEGGYLANHNLYGRWLGAANKGIVSQSRILWFFSRLASSQYGNADHLDAASHGFRFLRDAMWDSTFGGFYWEVDSRGEHATRAVKHIYGQMMALYALAEYAIASRDPAALKLADDLFQLVEERAVDRVHGGYHEFFRTDWGEPSLQDVNPLGARLTPAMKTTNTHLRALEALTRYEAIQTSDFSRQRLLQLILTLNRAPVITGISAYGQTFHEDWRPTDPPARTRVSYGHDVETIWLLIDASRVVGFSSSPLLHFYRDIFATAIRHGFDRRSGGFYTEGSAGRPADRREKIWWVQAEALVGSLKMYHLTREQVYFECFRQTLHWIATRQVDWHGGEWFEEVTRRGPRGVKAGPWKDPYHQGRAAMECLRLLDNIVMVVE